MKKLVIWMLAIALVLPLAACGTGDNNALTNETSEIELIIREAQEMTLEELAWKAIAESNGKTFYGVGNSSRGKSALPLFVEYL